MESANPRLKIVFVMRHAGYSRNFESTLRTLAQRGHSLQVVDERPPKNEAPPVIIEALCRDFPNVVYFSAPRREKNPAEAVARGIRLSLDYLRYLTPEYRGAIMLRQRAAERVPEQVGRLLALPFATSRPARALFNTALRAVEQTLPYPDGIDTFLRTERPDVLLITPLVELGSNQADWVRAAKAHGIRTALCVASWDNLTNKGLLRDVPDIVAVWNDAQKREAVQFHSVPTRKVAVTGATAYDHWFDWQASRSRETFCRMVGLRPEQPFVLFVCSSAFIAADETAFVRRWIAELRKDRNMRDIGVLIRPHPQKPGQWMNFEPSELDQVAIWPREGTNPLDRASRDDYYDSMYYCAAVMGINTSAQIESAIVGRAVFTILTPEFAGTQGGTLHFHHLANPDDGLLHTARSFGEHLSQLKAELQAPTGAMRSRRFVEAFVRPYGLDEPAAPRLVHAIEALITLSSSESVRPRPWAPLVQLGIKAYARAERRRQQRVVAGDKPTLPRLPKEKHAVPDAKKRAVAAMEAQAVTTAAAQGGNSAATIRQKTAKPTLKKRMRRQVKRVRRAPRRLVLLALQVPPIRKLTGRYVAPALSDAAAKLASVTGEPLKHQPIPAPVWDVITPLTAIEVPSVVVSNNGKAISPHENNSSASSAVLMDRMESEAQTTVKSLPLDKISLLNDRLRDLKEGLGANEVVFAGPWLGEVGFEIMYWIPFLRWVKRRYPGIGRRLAVISRGGTADWYRDIVPPERYVDVFTIAGNVDLHTWTMERLANGLSQKQTNHSAFELRLIEQATLHLGARDSRVLHPSEMYEVFGQLRKYDTIGWMKRISDYQSLPRPDLGPLKDVLPKDYLAVRFYFNNSFPETPENCQFVASLLQELAAHQDVVLLNPRIQVDDHRDFEQVLPDRVIRIDRFLKPENNLAVQSIAISRARAFVGTYGGLSYLAPHFGVDSLSFYSDSAQFNGQHLELAGRVFQGKGWGRYVALSVEQALLARLKFEALHSDPTMR